MADFLSAIAFVASCIMQHFLQLFDIAGWLTGMVAGP